MEEYTRVKFVSGPFTGLLGKTLTAANEDRTIWYAEVMIAGRPVVREVTTEEIERLR